MKPADHPEFFRFPAPEGRSRESTIRLDADGRFWHDGAIIEHAPMAQAFAGWVDRHPDDGRYVLNNGYDWTYFTVEDVPLFVRALSVAPGGALLHLSDGTTEPLDPASVRVGARDAVYVSVRGGRFEARFMPAAQVALAPLLEEGPDGAPELCLGGTRFAVRPRVPAALTTAPAADPAALPAPS